MRLGSHAALRASPPTSPRDPTDRELREDAYYDEREELLREIARATSDEVLEVLEVQLDELDRRFHQEPDYEP